VGGPVARSGLSTSRAALLLVAAAAGIVLLAFLLPSERLSGGYDWFQNWRYHKAFIRSSILEEGTIPLWCRWSFSGMPFLANPQTMLFYPGTLLFVLLPASIALPVDTLMHYALAGIGMLLFCRARGLPSWAGLFAGVAFMASGFNLAHTTVGHVHYYASVAWMPFVFLAVERWIQSRSTPWISVGAVSIAMQMFAGAVPVAWMTMVFGGLYGVGRVAEARWLGDAAASERGTVLTWRPVLITLAGLILVFVLGLVICSAQILPTRELVSLSLRQGTGYEFATRDSLPVAELVHLVAPPLLGRRIAWEFYGYFGLSTWVLAGTAVFARRLFRGGWTLLALAGLAALMMLGDATPFFRALYMLVPGLSLFRVHAREVLVLGFCVASLAASGLGGAIESARASGARGARDSLKRTLIVSVVVVSAGALLLTLLSNDPPAGSPELLWLFVAIGSTVAAARLQPRGRWTMPLLVGLLVLDLLAAERVTRDRLTIRTSAPPAQETLAAVLRADEGYYRFWYPRRHFMSNQGYAERRSAVEGYENMLLRRYQSFIHAMTGAPLNPDVITILTQRNFTHAPSPFPFKVLNVKHAALPQREGTYTTHMNPDPCGPAFLVDRYEVLPEEEILARMRSVEFDPRTVVLLEEEPPGPPLSTDEAVGVSGPPGGTGEVSIVRMTPNRVHLAVDARRDSILVLSEIHYPGWRAIVDGVEHPVLRADYILRAVRVPRGRHEVEFYFRPTSLPLGLLLSAGGLIACAALAIVGSRDRPRGRGPTAASSETGMKRVSPASRGG
jgi:hypothetical protein